MQIAHRAGARDIEEVELVFSSSRFVRSLKSRLKTVVEVSMFSLSKYFGAKPYSPSKGSSFCSLPRYAAHTSAIITTGNSSPLLACMVIIFMLSVEAAEGAEISKPSFNRARNAETPSPAPSAASLLTFLSFCAPLGGIHRLQPRALHYLIDNFGGGQNFGQRAKPFYARVKFVQLYRKGVGKQLGISFTAVSERKLSVSRGNADCRKLVARKPAYRR